MEYFNKKYWFKFYTDGLLRIRDMEFKKVDETTFKKHYLEKDFYFYVKDKKIIPYSFTFHLNNIWFPRFKYVGEEIVLR